MLNLETGYKNCCVWKCTNNINCFEIKSQRFFKFNFLFQGIQLIFVSFFQAINIRDFFI